MSDFIFNLLATDGFFFKVILGSIFGLCLGLTGVGGGVLLIPMLQIFCGMSPVLAVGTASLISAIVKINASIVHIKQKNVSWKNILFMFVGALPATILITQVVIYFNQHPIHGNITELVVTYLVTLVMIGSLLSVFIKFVYNSQDELVTKKIVNGGRKAILSGFFCGSILGSTGVGGGVLLLPVLNSILQVDIKKSIGSSVVLALFLSGFAALGYAKGGQADINTALCFVLGSFVGVPISAVLLKRISVKSTYIITLSVISISLILYIFF